MEHLEFEVQFHPPKNLQNQNLQAGRFHCIFQTLVILEFFVHQNNLPLAEIDL